VAPPTASGRPPHTPMALSVAEAARPAIGSSTPSTCRAHGGSSKDRRRRREPVDAFAATLVTTSTTPSESAGRTSSACQPRRRRRGHVRVGPPRAGAAARPPSPSAGFGETRSTAGTSRRSWPPRSRRGAEALPRAALSLRRSRPSATRQLVEDVLRYKRARRRYRWLSAQRFADAAFPDGRQGRSASTSPRRSRPVVGLRRMTTRIIPAAQRGRAAPASCARRDPPGARPPRRTSTDGQATCTDGSRSFSLVT
jgi:hypothetical protein